MNPTTSRTLFLFLLAILLAAVPANAQYLYLDSNGDGVHTSADVLGGSGTNVVDVWIITNQNRDGSLAICDAAGESGTPLTIGSYLYVLEAVGGTVAYGTPVNRQAGMSLDFGGSASATEIVEGWGGATPEPPGAYRLSSLTITVVSGTPSVRFIPFSPLDPAYPTSFGTRCSGLDLDNTYKLGSDFADADGLPYSPGAPQNSAPVLDPPSDMTVAVGNVATQSLRASDSDGNDMNFFLVGGPSYAVVATAEPGLGAAQGEVLLRPIRSDVGAATITVGVSDQLLTDQKSFVATIVVGPNHAPRLAAPQRIRVEAGAIAREPLDAWDPDGDAIAFRKDSGPGYVTVESPGSGTGGAHGHIVAAPSACDVGASVAVVIASDGSIDASAAVDLEVIEPAPVPSTPVARLDIGDWAFGVAVGDWNRDGKLDGAGLDWGTGTATTFLGDGAGAMGGPATYSIGPYPQAIVSGDWNRDGRLDLAATAQGTALAVLLGRGDGTFDALPPITGSSPLDFLATADLDRDGFADIVSIGHGYRVALGRGDATFDLSPVRPLAARSPSVAIGDFDRDGWPDLLICGTNSGPAIGFLKGQGNGAFAEPRYIPAPFGAYSLRAADLNRDGALDAVATSNELEVSTLLGDGAGGFAWTTAVTGFLGPWSCDVLDWDGDGIRDALVADELFGTLSLLRGVGDGSLVKGALGVPAAMFGSMGVAAGDFNGDGRTDFLGGSAARGELVVVLNTRPPRVPLTARTFQRGDHAAVPAAASSRAVTLFVEPIDAAFEPSDVNPESIRLRSEGTGSVAEISPIAGKSLVVSDADQNGTTELAVRFAAADVAALFSEIRGMQELSASLDGALDSGGHFCSRTTIRIVGVGGSSELTASVSPNPLNPRGVLRVETTQTGPLRVRLYDLQGRLVRTIADRASAPADRHEFEIGGEDSHGRPLATGVYFYRVETGEGSRSGRFTILK